MLLHLSTRPNGPSYTLTSPSVFVSLVKLRLWLMRGLPHQAEAAIATSCTYCCPWFTGKPSNPQTSNPHPIVTAKPQSPPQMLTRVSRLETPLRRRHAHSPPSSKNTAGTNCGLPRPNQCIIQGCSEYTAPANAALYQSSPASHSFSLRAINAAVENNLSHSIEVGIFVHK